MNHPLIPAGAYNATVEHIEFDIRTMFDYQVDFMRDRLLVTAHVDNEPRPVAYATVAGFEWEDADAILLSQGPMMRRRVIDHHLQLGYQGDLDALEDALRDAHAEIAALRRPLWRKVLDKVGSWIEGLR